MKFLRCWGFVDFEFLLEFTNENFNMLYILYQQQSTNVFKLLKSFIKRQIRNGCKNFGIHFNQISVQCDLLWTFYLFRLLYFPSKFTNSNMLCRVEVVTSFKLILALKALHFHHLHKNYLLNFSTFPTHPRSFKLRRYK